MPGEDVHLLLVEDDDIDVRLITRAFQKHKIANPITVVRNGIEALAILRGEGENPPLPQPSLILLDLNMPRMGGIEFLTALRQDHALRGSVVFVLTTSEDDRDKVAAYQQNIAGYLLKSAVGQGFLEVVGMLEQFVITVQFPPVNV